MNLSKNMTSETASNDADRLVVGDPEKLTLTAYTPQSYYRIIELLEGKKDFLVFEL